MRQRKITLGEMRANRRRALLVYCSNYKCGHLRQLAPDEVDQWSDDVKISDIEPKFVCTKCGVHGADIEAST